MGRWLVPTGGVERLGALLVGGRDTVIGSEVTAPDTAGVGCGLGLPSKTLGFVLMITGGRETLGTLLVGGGNTAVGSEVPGPDTAGVGEGVGKPRFTLGLVVVFTGSRETLGTLLACGVVGPDTAKVGSEVASSETAGDGSVVGIPGETFGPGVMPIGGVESLGTLIFSSLGTLLGGGVFGPDTTVGSEVVAPGTTILVGFVLVPTVVAATLGALLLSSLGGFVVCPGRGVGFGAAEDGAEVGFPVFLLGLESSCDGKGVGMLSAILGPPLVPPDPVGSLGASLFLPLGTLLLGGRLGLLLVDPAVGM
jgi:hypothetical protein